VARAETAEGRKRGGRSSLVELVTIVVVALGLALGIQAFLVKPFRIPSESMVPTLAVGQRVLVDRVTFRFGAPDRGDIVVFKPPKGADDDVCGVNHSEFTPCPRPTAQRSDTNFIKRVVAKGGDQIEIRSGRVMLKKPGDSEFRQQKEPFIRPSSDCDICNLTQPITIPKGYFFMMGDNRGASDDSRKWGPIPEKWMIGKAFATYWPPGKIGTL
jgi:signal peptidase I